MARKKVKLAWITNDSTRKSTYKKRKKGLLKKVSELSTLCGVDACAVIYGPVDNKPEVWPSPEEAQNIVTKFKGLPEMEQSKKMMNQEAFIGQRMAKLREQLKKQEKENRQLEVSTLLHQCLSGKSLREASARDLTDLSWLIDSKLRMTQERIHFIKETTAAEMKQQEKERMMKEKEERERMMKEKGEAEGRAMKALEEVAAMEMEAFQRQQWFMDALNSQDPMEIAVPQDHFEMAVPFGDGNLWFDDGGYPGLD